MGSPDPGNSRKNPASFTQTLQNSLYEMFQQENASLTLPQQNVELQKGEWSKKKQYKLVLSSEIPFFPQDLGQLKLSAPSVRIFLSHPLVQDELGCLLPTTSPHFSVIIRGSWHYRQVCKISYFYMNNINRQTGKISYFYMNIINR